MPLGATASGYWYLHNSFCPLSPDELAAMAIDSNSHLFGKFIGGEGRVRGLNGRSNQPLTLTLSPSVRIRKTAVWIAILCELTGRRDKMCRDQFPGGRGWLVALSARLLPKATSASSAAGVLAERWRDHPARRALDNDDAAPSGRSDTRAPKSRVNRP